MKKILLPLDCSEASLKAIVPAKCLARIVNATISIVHISEEEFDLAECLKKFDMKPENLGGYMITHKSGDPAKIILEEAENCDYIIMGTHGQTCDTSQKAGSVAIEVVENTYKPVLLIRPELQLKCKGPDWAPDKVLIPLNGSPNSAQALVPAMEIVAKTNAEIDLLHISSHKQQTVKEEGAYTAPFYEDYPQYEWGSWSNEFIRRFCPQLPNHNHINFKLSLSHGEPAEEILNFVRENHNDFIAMAWHGTFSSLRASVLKKVLFEAPCPIMLIKIRE